MEKPEIDPTMICGMNDAEFEVLVRSIEYDQTAESEQDDRVADLIAHAHQLRTRAFPPVLTPPLARVLSMMLWDVGPVAAAFRMAGQNVENKAEAEQALVLHWLVGLVLEHGDHWLAAATAELDRLKTVAEARLREKSN